jgi:hypothetical protein
VTTPAPGANIKRRESWNIIFTASDVERIKALIARKIGMLSKKNTDRSTHFIKTQECTPARWCQHKTRA